MSTLFISRMMSCMDRSEILRILMPERTKQIALAWSILRQSHLSEDAYQDMLARVFENDGIFEGPGHLRGIEITRPDDLPDSGRDNVTLSQDRRTLSLDLSASSAVDQIRVIVSEQ